MDQSPYSPVIVVSIFFSIPSFPANPRPVLPALGFKASGARGGGASGLASLAAPVQENWELGLDEGLEIRPLQSVATPDTNCLA